MDSLSAPIPSISPQPAESPSRRWFLWSAIGLIFLVFGIAIGIFGVKFFSQSTTQPQISTYQDCLAAKGSLVQESYPATCVTVSGQRFVQPLTDEEKQSLQPPDLYREPTSSAATSDWKTYTDPQNQYSVKYPPEITLSSYREGTYSGIHLLLIGPTQTASGRTQTTLSDGVSIKTLIITDVLIPLQQYAEQRRVAESQSAPKDDPQPTVSKLSEVLIAGKSGYRYTVDDRGGRAQVTLVFLNGNILQIVTHSASSVGLTQQYVSLIDQILSTFKFTD